MRKVLILFNNFMEVDFMKKLKWIVKDAMRNHYSKKCNKNIEERTKLLDELKNMVWEDDPEAFKTKLATVKAMSEIYTKLYEKKVKYY